jgi:hypothetical protein
MENGRVSFMVNMYEKKPDQEKQTIAEESERYIEELDRYL